jgi:hypothetical protein
MEGFLYLLDVIFVIWLLIMIKRHDRDPEAMKKGLLGVFSMAQGSEKKPATEKKHGEK